MENAVRSKNTLVVKHTGNVIGLFPGLLPSYSEKNSSMSLTVSAARLELASFEGRLAKLGIRLSVSDETLAEIAKTGFEPARGARPMQQIIELEIEYPISKAVMKGKFSTSDTIHVRVKNGAISFEK